MIIAAVQEAVSATACHLLFGDKQTIYKKMMAVFIPSLFPTSSSTPPTFSSNDDEVRIHFPRRSCPLCFWCSRPIHYQHPVCDFPFWMMFLDYQMRGGIFMGPFSAPTLSFANQFYSLGLAEPVRLLFAPFPICPAHCWSLCEQPPTSWFVLMLEINATDVIDASPFIAFPEVRFPLELFSFLP